MTPTFTIAATCRRCMTPLPPVSGTVSAVAQCPHCAETWLFDVSVSSPSPRADLLVAPAVGYHPLIDLIHAAIDESPELSLGDSQARRRKTAA